MKQVIILRKDLNMRKGKMVAQGAHASMAAILKELNNEYVVTWLDNSFTKVCVSVNSEQELLDIYNSSNTFGIPCALIRDNGKTEFNNIPTYTAVAVGPAPSNIIDNITGHLKLL